NGGRRKMYNKEERDGMRQELLRSFRPQPPPPKPTPTQQLEERGANRPDEAIIQDAAKSAEAQVEMAQRWRRDRRREQEAKEIAEHNDPRARYQRELDRWWQLQRDFADALDDHVMVG